MTLILDPITPGNTGDPPSGEAAGETVPEATRRTAQARFLLGTATLLTLLLGGVGYLTGLHAAQVIGLTGFCLVGLGSTPWQFNPWLRLHGRLTLSVLTSLLVLILISTPMALTGRWFPDAAMTALAAVSVPVHVLALGKAFRDLRQVRAGQQMRQAAPPTEATPLDVSDPDAPSTAGALRRKVLARIVTGTVTKGARGLRSPATLALVGSVVCLGSAVAHPHLPPQFGGFPTQLGVPWVAGLLVILAAITLAGRAPERSLAVAVGCLMLVLTLTPGLVYDAPRSQSAAKHVDLLQQIQTLGRLDSSVEIYNSWPGFFGATAWLVDFTGIDNPMHLATLWPALLGMFRLVALRYFFGKILRDPGQAWIAVTLALLADPQGADYFSPQSVGFTMALAIFGLALAARQTRTRTLTILLAGCALAVAHQLSPYIVGGALVVLVLFGLVRPRLLPLLVLVPALAWAGMNLDVVRTFVSWGDFGSAENFRPPVTVASEGLQRQPIVGLTVTALVVSVLVVGVLAAVTVRQTTGQRFLRRAARRQWSRAEAQAWAMACAAGVGLVVVFANPYGQEGIFRAVLFGTPWLALLAAHQFPSDAPPRRRILLAAVAGLLTLTFCVASFGLDRINVVRTGDLTAFEYFDAQGTGDKRDPQFLLILGKGDLPTTPARSTTTHDLVSRDTLRMPVRQEPGTRPDEMVADLTAKLLRYSTVPAERADLFALWSPTSQAYGEAYGLQSAAQFAELRDAFAASTYWSETFERDGTVVYRFDGDAYVRSLASDPMTR
ncbi:MAG TPA: hypothetical protein VIT65_12680 [Microlunatus sp.]